MALNPTGFIGEFSGIRTLPVREVGISVGSIEPCPL